jgi:hypothetical protein
LDVIYDQRWDRSASRAELQFDVGVQHQTLAIIAFNRADLRGRRSQVASDALVWAERRRLVSGGSQ